MRCDCSVWNNSATNTCIIHLHCVAVVIAVRNVQPSYRSSIKMDAIHFSRGVWFCPAHPLVMKVCSEASVMWRRFRFISVGGVSEDQRQIQREEQQQQQADVVSCRRGCEDDPAFNCWVHALLLWDVLWKHRNVHVTWKREESECFWDWNIGLAADWVTLHLALKFGGGLNIPVVLCF